jgi:hypothetical protein
MTTDVTAKKSVTFEDEPRINGTITPEEEA